MWWLLVEDWKAVAKNLKVQGKLGSLDPALKRSYQRTEDIV